MGISELCIRRPVFTTLVTATFIVFGVFAYRLLSVAALPAVDFPTIQISATLPGASAETMAASVAAPIERQLAEICVVDARRILRIGQHSSGHAERVHRADLTGPTHEAGRIFIGVIFDGVSRVRVDDLLLLKNTVIESGDGQLGIAAGPL